MKKCFVNKSYPIPLLIIILSFFSIPIFGQFIPYQVDNSFSTEWEATAFNGGRRLVRDSDGYLHTVYHTKPTTGTLPTGTGCSIFYAYSTKPCNLNIAPVKVDWVITEIVRVADYSYDNRYPALIIEHGTPSNPKGNDVLHLVWQRDPAGLSAGNGDYEIWYMNTYGNDIDIAGGKIAIWNPPVKIWDTPANHDLVPSIACNYNNHLHLAWQAEKYDGDSEILYARSVNHGATWTDNFGVALTTFGGIASPYNLSNNSCSSQCPSIACIIDAPDDPKISPGQMGYIPGTVDSYTYTTSTVHIVWHDKLDSDLGSCTTLPGNYHIWYSYSPDDGNTWLFQEDVTNMTLGDRDIYASLTVDYYDQPHIAFMHNCDNDHDPSPSLPPSYLAGVDPYQTASFPGPDPRMYGNNNPSPIPVKQFITYTNRTWLPPLPNGIWQPRQYITMGPTDDEFPSIALDEQMGIHIAWQSWGQMTQEYVIMTCFKQFNWIAPGFNSWLPWSSNLELTQDGTNDDLFPSEAHKKLSMYSGGTMSDLDLVWTRVNGIGRSAAIDNVSQEIWYLGATVWSDPPPVTPSPTPLPTLTPTPMATVTPTPQATPTPEATVTPTPEATPTPDITPTPATLVPDWKLYKK